MNSYILNFAPTGMVPTKLLNPNVPISVSEIVDDVLMAAEYGASIVHLHARHEKTGEPLLSPEIYGAIIEKIRLSDKNIILCVSLSGRNVSDPELRAAPLTLNGEMKPDMGSLTLSSLNFPNQPSINAPQTIDFLAAEMMRRGVHPEIEIFDLGMANYLNVLIKKKLLPEKIYANVLFGNIFGAQLSFAHIAALLSNLPANIVTSFAGLGTYQLPATVLALTSGHGIRIGLEDNLWFDSDRKVLTSNARLLERITSISTRMEKVTAPPSQVRKMLGLHPGDGKYGSAAQ